MSGQLSSPVGEVVDELVRAVGLTPDIARRTEVTGQEPAISFRSERYLRVDGRVSELRDPPSGDYRAGDSRWVRLHCNYGHHRRAAVGALDGAEDRTAMAEAVRRVPPLQWRSQSSLPRLRSDDA